jgi:hypothetical protein
VNLPIIAGARESCSNGRYVMCPVLQKSFSRGTALYGRNAACQQLLRQAQAPVHNVARQNMVRNVHMVRSEEKVVENGKPPHTTSFQGIKTEEGENSCYL